MVSIDSGHVKGYTRRFKIPLSTSQGTINERCGFIIRYEGPDGFAGHGEATFDSKKDAEYQLNGLNIDNDLKGHIWDQFPDAGIPFTMKTAYSTNRPEYSAVSPAFQFALDTAFYDYMARLMKKPMSWQLREETRTMIPVNYLISGPVSDPGRTANEIISGGYRAVKVKVGAVDIEAEISMLRFLRKTLGPEIAIRLDANGAWDYDQAHYAIRKMLDFDIEYIEEPLKRFSLGKMADLKYDTDVRIALDESLLNMANIEKILDTGVVDTIILKPARHGIARTRELYDIASRHNCKAVITSNLETEIGIAAQLHLAASLPGDLSPLGLDTLRLYENAKASLCDVVDGAIKLPEGDGIGIGDEIWESL